MSFIIYLRAYLATGAVYLAVVCTFWGLSSSQFANSQSARSGKKPGVLFVIDASGSMAGEKLREAKTSAQSAIRKAVEDGASVSILAFSGNCRLPVFSQFGYSDDISSLTSFVERLQANGGTPLSSALRRASEIHQQNGYDPQTALTVLLADGDDDCGGVQEALNSLRVANGLFRHETIGLDVATNSEASAQLNLIASESGGNYKSAENAGELEAVLDDISDELREAIAENTEAQRQKELAEFKRIRAEEAERIRAEQNLDARTAALKDALTESAEASETQRELRETIQRVEQELKDKNKFSYAVCGQTLGGRWMCDGPTQRLLANHEDLSEALKLVGCDNPNRARDIESDRFKKGCGHVFSCTNPQQPSDRDIVDIWDLGLSYEFAASNGAPRCSAFGLGPGQYGLSMALNQSRGGTGYYTFRNNTVGGTAGPDLQTVGYFTKVGSVATNFTGLCESIQMKCEYVVDWQGNRLSCDEPGRRHDRAAFCSGSPTYSPGFYGFKEVQESPYEDELEVRSKGFRRIYTGASKYDSLCLSIGLTCKSVVDHQGENSMCSSFRDVNKVAYCE